ncbi:TetR/AcrR family transcriptional regulator [Jiangella asiatica]|uniref:TetR/AcrR family transcriptional regulator n=1 Tax=Jiangella asiatica TaxID=2530372 RepID=A0A4R5CGE9_9ACTN|nr:helix-turn-helix domain-containing protein [Jiangella asiatica]TDD97540.1 TetR/AcrR family transcriptional regulator [Jiangella asiatica]
MSENARPKRRYDSTNRRIRAAQTRTHVVETAGRVFVELGYARATIPRIAAEAGVAVETVYRTAAGKAGLLQAAVLAAVAGGVERSDVPVEQRPAIRQIIEEPDPRRQLRAYAATQPGIWSRVGPLLRVLDAAAATDDALQALQTQQADLRHTGLRRFAGLLESRGALRPDVSTDRAADIIWTVCAQSTYDALVLTCGWSHEEYERWIGDTLIHALLPPGDEPRT